LSVQTLANMLRTVFLAAAVAPGVSICTSVPVKQVNWVPGMPAVDTSAYTYGIICI
jgi:hypothetical protein